MEKTEIDELIEQAKAQQRRWKFPHEERKFSNRTWQEVLDNKPYPHIRIGNL